MLRQNTSVKRMPLLDSLRGVAALIVVFHHFMVFNGEQLSKEISPFLIRLFHHISDLNVEAILFFFVLSGFSIGLAQRGALLNGRAEANFYFYKRFKRILPIYLIALGLAAMVGLITGSLQKESYSLTNLLGNIIFLQTSAGATDYWFTPYGENGPLWSLAYEMFFYFFFPLFSVLLLKTKLSKVKAPVFILLTIIAFACIGFNKYVIFIPPLAFLSFYLVWWAGFQISVEYLNRTPDFLFWGLLLGASITLLSFQHKIPSASVLEIIKALLIGCTLFFLLFLNINWASNFKNKTKAIINQAFNAIGHGSYALYALHYPVFILMNNFEIKWMYQIIFIFALIITCIVLEKKLTHKKFSMFALDYMLINHKKLG